MTSNDVEQSKWRKLLFKELTQSFLAAPRMAENPNAYIGCISACMDLSACCIEKLLTGDKVELDLNRSPIECLSTDVKDLRFGIECMINSFFVHNMPGVRNAVIEQLKREAGRIGKDDPTL